MSPVVVPVLFLAGIVALACALLAGLYFLIRHEPLSADKSPNKIAVSNLK
jgi:hypothetical protein